MTKRTAKKPPAKRATALVSVKPTMPPAPLTTTETLTRVQYALMQLGATLSNVADADLGQTMATVRQFGDVLEAAEASMKARILPYIKANGMTVTEKGSMRATINGYMLEAQPTRTGYDSKKVEALLRARGIEPETAMDAVVTYKVNEGKLADTVRSGAVSTDEAEATRYDLNYRVMVKKAASDE